VHEAVRKVLRSWGWEGVKTGGWVGLGVLGVVAGLVAGVAEALGTFTRLPLPLPPMLYFACVLIMRLC
jgi:hypothetical protein